MSKLVRLDSLFLFEAARSHGIDDYEPGIVPFVTSTSLNNGVVSYVVPLIGDRVFSGPALSISGLGVATLQVSDFLPKGNGGDSLTVCKPISTMSVATLLGYTAAFNALHSWRFSFGRKCSPKRLAPLEVPGNIGSVVALWEKETASVHQRADRLGSAVSRDD